VAEAPNLNPPDDDVAVADGSFAVFVEDPPNLKPPAPGDGAAAVLAPNLKPPAAGAGEAAGAALNLKAPAVDDGAGATKLPPPPNENPELPIEPDTAGFDAFAGSDFLSLPAEERDASQDTHFVADFSL